MSVRVHPAEPGGTVEGPIEAGLDDIRAQFHVPGAFPDDVLAAADDAARRRPGRDHVDRTSWAFRTLDPAGSTDLDQAFFIDADAAAGAQGGDLVLHYAIADVDFFVDPGGPIDHEAWAAGRDDLPARPALDAVPAGAVRGGGEPAPRRTTAGGGVHGARRRRRRGAPRRRRAGRRAQSRQARLRRHRRGVDPGIRRALPAHRAGRGSTRRAAGGVPGAGAERTRIRAGRLRFEARLESEDQNAGMSLATNLAVADALLAARTGLFRVMADVPDSALRRLRHTATAFHLDWPADMSLARFERSLPRDDPRAAAFLLAVRRSGGAASYQPYIDAASTVALGDRRDLRPRHGAAAPPRRPLRHRRGARRGQRRRRPRARRAGVPRAARRDGAGRPGSATRSTRRCSTSPRPCCCRVARARCSTASSSTRTSAARSCSSPSRRCWPVCGLTGSAPATPCEAQLVRADPASRSIELDRVG